MKLLGAILLALVGSVLAYKTYSGYQVLQTLPVTADNLYKLHLMQNDPRFDFWTVPRVGHPALIMTAPEHIPYLTAQLRWAHLAPTVYIEDVGVTIERERAAIETIKRNEKRDPREITYDRFMDVEELMLAIHQVAATHPFIASIFELADSTEGRGVHGLKISTGPGKKSVWIDCNFHAREWLTPPVCLKSIEMVIASTELQELADWYILPMTNPDGYAYAWTDDRLWRKTRRPNPGSDCVGTDPNRNFDFLWNGDNNNDACTNNYPGDVAFSEPECKGIGDFVTQLSQDGNLAIYLTIHSYGALLLYPWGHTNEPAPNKPELQAAGDEAAAAIAEYRGTTYFVGPSGESLYYTYGASDDWAYGAAGVQYSYTFELPGGGPNGFDPPPSDILPCVEETWPGIESLVRRALAAQA